MILSRQQSGLSLVELMIALVIGSFLILGATQLYLSSKQNQLFAGSSAENLDGARYSTMVLDEELSKAGFRRAPDQNIAIAFPSTAATNGCRNFAAGSAIAPLSDGSSSGFCFRYQPATNDEKSCSGQEVGVSRAPFSPSPSSELVYVSITFEEGDELHDGALRCTSIQGGSKEEDVIIDGVADFRVFMAEGDTTERRLQNAELKLASTVGANAIVRAVGYEMLLASGPNRREGDSKVFTEYLSGLSTQRKNVLQSNDKRHVYQVATGGQAIRNLMP